VCCLSIFEGEGLKPGQVFSRTFRGITFERNETFHDVNSIIKKILKALI
jgi:ferredoxin-fold anticodon binding domain-containing protein